MIQEADCQGWDQEQDTQGMLFQLILKSWVFVCFSSLILTSKSCLWQTGDSSLICKSVQVWCLISCVVSDMILHKTENCKQSIRGVTISEGYHDIMDNADRKWLNYTLITDHTMKHMLLQSLSSEKQLQFITTFILSRVRSCPLLCCVRKSKVISCLC